MNFKMRSHQFLLIILILVLIDGCKREYTLEESKQIQYVKDLITEINKNVDQQKALLELIETEKDLSLMIKRKLQLNHTIDEYELLNKQIKKEIDILNTANIDFEFDKIDSTNKKINLY